MVPKSEEDVAACIDGVWATGKLAASSTESRGLLGLIEAVSSAAPWGLVLAADERNRERGLARGR
ncbi:MAG TPA: hypothetical protein ENJ50_09115 [Planctomycetaceae bacterium]|nr:hypothetical protein [Planctomycetaceae bacterium]